MNIFIQKFVSGIPMICVFFLIISAAILCFYKLGQAPLSRWDEQTNRQVVIETLAHPFSTTLYLNNRHFFEKPPLWYVFTAVFVKATGNNNAAFRIISALSAFIIICITFYIGAVYFSSAAAVTAIMLILSTGQLFLVNPGRFFSTHNFRSADSDTLQILFMLIGFLLLFMTVKGKTKLIYPATIFGALAILTKGILGILPLIIFCIYQFLILRKSLLTKAEVFNSLIIFLSILMPWHILMYVKYGSAFTDNYFFYHMLYRLSIPIEGHAQPWRYYLQLLTTRQVFPVPEILLISMFNVIFNRKLLRDFGIFSTLGISSGIFIIAAVTRTRLAWYILGIYPFISILIGAYISGLLDKIKSGKLKNHPWGVFILGYTLFFTVFYMIQNLKEIINL